MPDKEDPGPKPTEDSRERGFVHLPDPLDPAGQFALAAMQKDKAFYENEMRCRGLRKLFEDAIEELTKDSKSLIKTSIVRMKRYKLTRITIALTMCWSVIAMFVANFNGSAFDILLTRMSPIIMIGAIFFYVLQAFFRDYEVSLCLSQNFSSLLSRLQF